MGNRTNKAKTTKNVPVNKPASYTYDHEEGARALESLRPALMAIESAEVKTARIDGELAAYTVLSVAKMVQSDEVRPRFAALPEESFDITNVDGLAETALASLYALEQVQDEGALDTRAKLRPEIVQEATELERRMQTVCEYYLSDDPEIAPILERLRPGIGYRDLLNDLKGYARIYERRAEVVSADTKNYRPEDLQRSRELAAIIGRAFVDARSKSARTAYDLYARCWVLLSSRYEEVRQAGLWLFRADARKDEMFPSLYTATRPSVDRSRRPQEMPAPEEAAPVSGEQEEPLADVA